MSRFAIELVREGAIDTNAVIGYDPPMRTFFLQGFEREVDGCIDFEIWLGTVPGEFPTLASLGIEIQRRGYEISRIERRDILEMLAESDLRFKTLYEMLETKPERVFEILDRSRHKTPFLQDLLSDYKS